MPPTVCVSRHANSAQVETDKSSESGAPWPRLLYFGYVPVEDALHGSAQLFRLLRSWPASNVLIVEPDLRSRAELRLPNVTYRHLVPAPLPSYERFGSVRFFFRIAQSLKAIETAAAGFRPTCVLTVAHGREWFLAYLYARRAGIPLHLIVHDTGIEARNVSGRLHWHWLNEKVFGRVYRGAQSRLCVSPYMEEDYRRRYGLAGTVLLPSVGPDCPHFSRPADHSLRSRTFRLAYAGSIGHLLDDIVDAARCLESLGGELLVYGGNDRDRAALTAAAPASMRLMPLFATEAELVTSLHAEADAAYLPVTFDAALQVNMITNFPSKLTAYTAAALPVLLRGPRDCSAVRWAETHPGFSLLITDPSPAVLTSAMTCLMQDEQTRRALARGALRICDENFRHAHANAVFLQAARSHAEG